MKYPYLKLEYFNPETGPFPASTEIVEVTIDNTCYGPDITFTVMQLPLPPEPGFQCPVRDALLRIVLDAVKHERRTAAMLADVEVTYVEEPGVFGTRRVRRERWDWDT
jgi:hypothetical protein